jgi:hypothetical protein
MTGLVRKATLLTACGVLVAAAAMAGVPSSENSTVPVGFRMVGHVSGVADAAAGAFTIVVRDLANNPIPGSSVVLDFASCSDLRICSNQFNAGSIVACAGKTIHRITDGTGTVVFTVVGGSINNGQLPAGPNGGAANRCVKVFADGVRLNNPLSSIANPGTQAGAFDEDGASGVTSADLGSLLTDLGSGTAYHRSDYDFNGSVDSADLAELLTVLGLSASAESCESLSTYCP